MNERIEIVNDRLLRITRFGGSILNLEIREDIGPTSISIGGLFYDAEGRAALIDALQCLRDTGSFAALADTSAVPHTGKRMLYHCTSFGRHIEATVLAKSCDGFWYIDSGKAYKRAATDLLPLTPPAPKVTYRRMKATEAAEHLGRELIYCGEKFRLDSVGLACARLSVLGDPCPLWKDYRDLAETCIWADDRSPCGIQETPT